MAYAGGVRHATARQYREMLAEGIDPTRGLEPVVAFMVVAGIAAVVFALLAVGAVAAWWGGLRVPALFPFG